MTPRRRGSFWATTPPGKSSVNRDGPATPGPIPLPATAIDPLGSDMVDRSMLLTDGANHRRLRDAVRDVFTPSFITGLTDGVQTITQAVIDHPAAGEPFDFMTDIALPLPLTVAAEWLGLDPTTPTCCATESPAIIRMLGALADPDEINAGAAAFATLITEFLPLAADRRTHPGDDLLSFIAADPALELDDVVITAILIAVAGHETTANLLGAAMIRLLQPSEDGSRLIDNLDLADPALVNELLRLDGPVQATARTATRTTASAAPRSPPANRSSSSSPPPTATPAVFDQPDQFRLRRPRPSTALSSGTARTTASARPWHNSKSTRRCKGSLPANRSWRAGHLARHAGHPRTAIGSDHVPGLIRRARHACVRYRRHRGYRQLRGSRPRPRRTYSLSTGPHFRQSNPSARSGRRPGHGVALRPSRTDSRLHRPRRRCQSRLRVALNHRVDPLLRLEGERTRPHRRIRAVVDAARDAGVPN